MPLALGVPTAAVELYVEKLALKHNNVVEWFRIVFTTVFRDMVLTNRLELSFRSVRALPKASRIGCVASTL